MKQGMGCDCTLGGGFFSGTVVRDLRLGVAGAGSWAGRSVGDGFEFVDSFFFSETRLRSSRF